MPGEWTWTSLPNLWMEEIIGTFRIIKNEVLEAGSSSLKSA